MNTKVKCLAVVGAIVLVGLVGLEFFCRRNLGLGDPPLSVEDDKIEYLFAPNQSCRRFGNHVVYNDVSCRNAYDAASLTTNDVVMLVLGDSVVNGGALTDQAKLGTTRAEARMPRPVRVLNASAGSWGPVNCAEYVKRFGTFNAKAVYLVLNPGDLWDVPDYTPIVGTRAFPDKKPVLASWELVDRYAIPRLVNLVHPKKSRLETGEGLVRGGLSKDEAESRSKAAIAECLNRAPKRGVIYSRLRTDWAKAEPAEAEVKLRAFCREKGFEFHLLVLDPATDYRTNDNIHINENGQAKLGDLLVTLAPSA